MKLQVNWLAKGKLGILINYLKEIAVQLSFWELGKLMVFPLETSFGMDNNG